MNGDRLSKTYKFSRKGLANKILGRGSAGEVRTPSPQDFIYLLTLKPTHLH